MAHADRAGWSTPHRPWLISLIWACRSARLHAARTRLPTRTALGDAMRSTSASMVAASLMSSTRRAWQSTLLGYSGLLGSANSLDSAATTPMCLLVRRALHRQACGSPHPSAWPVPSWITPTRACRGAMPTSPGRAGSNPGYLQADGLPSWRSADPPGSLVTWRDHAYVVMIRSQVVDVSAPNAPWMRAAWKLPASRLRRRPGRFRLLVAETSSLRGRLRSFESHIASSVAAAGGNVWQAITCLVAACGLQIFSRESRRSSARRQSSRLPSRSRCLDPMSLACAGGLEVVDISIRFAAVVAMGRFSYAMAWSQRGLRLSRRILSASASSPACIDSIASRRPMAGGIILRQNQRILSIQHAHRHHDSEPSRMS